MLDTHVSRGSRVRPAVSRIGVVAAWLGIMSAAIISLHQAGAPTAQIIAYLGAWLVGCTFPGVMLWRALAGSSTLVKELGFGSVLGIVLQLVVWALSTGVHQPLLMWALPVGVAVPFAVVPRLRRHWWPQRSGWMRTPARWHLAMAVVIALSTYRFDRLNMVRRALPPELSLVARDTWYNSAVSYELSRTIRPQDPFAVGQPLRYHWFADAHVTATAQLSGTPIADAMITYWLIPILVVLLLAIAAAAQQFMDGPRLVGRDGAPLSDIRRWWVGPVAAFFSMVTPALWRLGSPGTQRVGDGFVASSPSGILAMVLILGLVGPVLDLLRGRGRRGTWVVLTLLLMTCVGTKPSILPVVACGALAVLVFDLVRSRRVNWPMIYVVGASAVIAIAGAPVLTGSTGGSHIQLLALLTIDPSYAQLLDGKPVVPAAGGWLVPALADGLTDAVPIIAMLLVVWLLTETPRLLGLLSIFSCPLRSDPGVVWAWGLLGGGYAGMWMLAHPGYSEHYFWTVTLSLANVLAVTSAARLLPAARQARTLSVPLVVVSIPAVIAAYVTTTFATVNVRAATADVIEGRLRPYTLMVVTLAGALMLALLLRVFVRRLSLPLFTAAVAFALAASLPVPVQAVLNARSPTMTPPPEVGVSYQYVSPEQQKAALWLQRHSAMTAVVATNSFCWPMGKDTPGCFVNSMWLSGLSGRRMVLSDWTYTSANMANYDGTKPINCMHSPWPERRILSTRAVEAPTARILGQLRRDYDARWIFADDRATKISPKLKRLATLRYRSEHIEIYQLRDSYPK